MKPTEMTTEQISNEITAINHIDFLSEADKNRLYELEEEYQRRKRDNPRKRD